MKKPTYEELEKTAEELRQKLQKSNIQELWNVCAQSPIPSFTVNYEGKIIEHNDAIAELVGYSSEEIKRVPDIDKWIRILIPDEEQFRIVFEIFGKVREGEIDVKKVEFTITRKDGENRSVEFSVYKIYHNGKPADVLIVQAVDITERKKAENELKHRLVLEQLLSDISRSFINIQPEKIDEGINRELHTIGDFSGADRCYIVIFSDNGKTMNVTHEWCANGIEPLIENFKGLSTDTYPWRIKKLKNLNTIYIPHIADLPNEADAEKQILQSHNIQSFVVVPIVYSKRLVGFLEFDYMKKIKKILGEKDIMIFKTVGDVFINALERKRTMEALRKSEEKYYTLTENINDIIYSMDDKGIFTYMGSQVTRYGYNPEEVISRPFLEFLVPEDREKTLYDFRRTLTTGEEFPTQFRVVDKKGGIHWVEDKGMIQRDGNGRIIGLAGILRDITERKQSEKALKASRTKLQEQKSALEQKTGALKEIIGQIEIEKNTIKNDVIDNVNEIILPILHKLKLKEASNEYIDILQHLLENLSSSFGRKITKKSIKLTPREIEISTLIESGLTNKEISKLLNISCQTVEKHRKNIRRKFGITNRDINLTSFLQHL